MKECTTIERPFALYNPEKEVDEIGCAGDGLLYCSIDNIPAQLPREATDYFGNLLLPWIPEMVCLFDHVSFFPALLWKNFVFTFFCQYLSILSMRLIFHRLLQFHLRQKMSYPGQLFGNHCD